MLYAAKNGLTYHLWWHPHNIGVKSEYHLGMIEEILEYYNLYHDVNRIRRAIVYKYSAFDSY
jgi:hypothetical protein